MSELEHDLRQYLAALGDATDAGADRHAGDRDMDAPSQKAGSPPPTSNTRRLLAFAGIAVVLLAAVAFAALSGTPSEDAAVTTSGSPSAEPAPPRAPEIGDHWHTAYGINICGRWLPPLRDQKPDTTGVHTHGDGLIHIHPFTTAATGAGANLRTFGETAGLVVTDTSITVAGGEVVTNGDRCEDGEPGQVHLVVWDSVGELRGSRVEQDLAHYAPQDGEVITVAFVPAGTEIDKPPSTVQLGDPLAAEEGRPLAGSGVHESVLSTAHRFVEMARSLDADSVDRVGFADEVHLLVGNRERALEPRARLAEEPTWQFDAEGYAARSGPLSLLEPIRGRAETDLTIAPGPGGGCPTPGDAFAILEYDHELLIEPANIDSCLEWFSINLFIHDGEVIAVQLRLYEP